MKTKEYPIISFRLNQSAKDEIDQELELTMKHLERTDKKRSWSKGEILADALSRGLKAIRANKRNKTA